MTVLSERRQSRRVLSRFAVVLVLVIAVALPATASAAALETSIPLPQSLGRLALDSTANRLYATFYDYPNGSGRYATIDLATRAVLRYRTCCDQGSSLAADPTTDHVYTAGSGPYVLSFDGATNDLLASNFALSHSSYNRIEGVAVDPATGRIYVPNTEAATVDVLESDTLTVINTIQLPAGSHPSQVAVDSSAQRVYVSLGGNSDNSGGLAAIDTATDTVVRTTPILGYPFGVAVDEQRHQVVVGNVNNDNLTVVESASGQTHTYAVQHRPQWVAVDQSSGHIYASTVDDVLNSASLAVVDEANGQVLDRVVLSGQQTAAELAVDSQHSRVYVGSYENRVWIVDDSSSAPSAAPTDPGAPSPSVSTSSDGVYSIDWTPSTGDDVTYVLQHKDDYPAASWETVASGLTSLSYSFGAEGHPAEYPAVWSYRVIAVDTHGHRSNPVQASSQVSVSQTPTVSRHVDAGGTVSLGGAPTATDPTSIALTTPIAGVVTIAQVSPDPSLDPGAGWQLLGQQYDITAPTANASSGPLSLTFSLDPSAFPPGGEGALAAVALVRNGTAIPDCDGRTLDPNNAEDVCVQARAVDAQTGIGSVTVIAWHASHWNLARRTFTTGAFSMGPQAMDGDLKVSPGDRLRVGYDFTMPGSHPATQVEFKDGKVTFKAACVSGSGGGSIIVALPWATYNDPKNSSAWYPSGDQKSDSTYQGQAGVPDLCGGGKMTLKSGGTFTGTVGSTQPRYKVNVRWHYGVNATAGGWSGTATVFPR